MATPRTSRRRAGSVPPSSSSRALARAVLERIERTRAFPNRALSTALDRATDMSAEERGLATELVYGTLRRRRRLDRALDALAERGLGSLDPPVRIALRVGAYQLLFLDRVPAYAAVSEAVEACKAQGGPGLGRLANALLRRLATRGEPPLPRAAEDPLGFLVEAVGLPEWVARLALAEMPAAQATALGEALGTAAPLTVRANRLRTDRDALAASLRAERPGAEIAPAAVAPDALFLRRVEAPFATDAWRSGRFAVEDAGAQVVGELCGAAAGERILDACAGLGGKTAHLQALAGNGARIDALDLAADKLAQARASFNRLGVSGVTTVVADLLHWKAPPERRYHRVLLDAPCSGLGVLRRRPDIAVRRTPVDLEALAGTQRRMLEAVAPRVLPGGVLTFAVCTFDRAECEDVVSAFLASHSEFAVDPPPDAPPWPGLADPRGFVRTWPQLHDADAFFAVRLRRHSARKEDH